MKKFTQIFAVMALMAMSAVGAKAEGEKMVGLVQPFAHEVLKSGQFIRVAWKSSNVENIKLEWRDTCSNEWNLVGIYPVKHSGTGIDAGGLAPWTAPETTCRDVQLRVSDAENPSVMAMMIYSTGKEEEEKSITMISPEEGEVLKSGVYNRIAWNSTGINAVNIECRDTTSGSEWIMIRENYPSPGMLLNWIPPVVESGVLYLRISAVEEPEVMAMKAFFIGGASSVTPEDVIPQLSITGENPASATSSWTIDFGATSGNCSLIDARGNSVWSFAGNSARLDFSTIASGPYFLKVEADGKIAFKNVVVVR